ncbi:hypothetical protein AXF42_Ash007274 [Apostasia shenzhenica]|uniref:Uncharacterized protein n=1 Tax=Apostasia shenzhenica TaxID=1088818 RepID=A0A2I0B9S6_9ASPA|nr:hypothetical protein AXF42_Ash007274 [Apostasia shenzhenica]
MIYPEDRTDMFAMAYEEPEHPTRVRVRKISDNNFFFKNSRRGRSFSSTIAVDIHERRKY